MKTLLFSYVFNSQLLTGFVAEDGLMLGAVVGILGFSKFLRWLLARWNKETLIVLAGFIIGSLVKVWPWSNTEAIQGQVAEHGLLVGPAVLFAVVGFGLVSGIEIAGKIIGKKKA